MVDTGREVARQAVAAELARRRWSVSDLARRAGIDHNTATTFVSGERWPIHKTQGSIEEALGWPSGTLDRLSHGGEVDLSDLPPPEVPDMEVLHLTARSDDEAVSVVVTVRRDAVDRVDIKALLRALGLTAED